MNIVSPALRRISASVTSVARQSKSASNCRYTSKADVYTPHFSFFDTKQSADQNHYFWGNRPYSSSTKASSTESKSTLLKILSREEKEEEESGNLDLPEELADIKTTVEKSWKIVEDVATTNLFKLDNPSGNKVQVSFHCQDTIETSEDQIYDGEDEGDRLLDDSEGEEDSEEDSAPVRFTVTVTKDGKSLNFACFSEFGEVKIDGVSTTGASTPKYVHENQGTLPKIEYQGPDFVELAQDLQEALADYLDEECGVNSDVATFIAMFTDYQEEKQYVNFLKQSQIIVS